MADDPSAPSLSPAQGEALDDVRWCVALAVLSGRHGFIRFEEGHHHSAFHQAQDAASAGPSFATALPPDLTSTVHLSPHTGGKVPRRLVSPIMPPNPRRRSHFPPQLGSPSAPPAVAHRGQVVNATHGSRDAAPAAAPSSSASDEPHGGPGPRDIGEREAKGDSQPSGRPALEAEESKGSVAISGTGTQRGVLKPSHRPSNSLASSVSSNPRRIADLGPSSGAAAPRVLERHATAESMSDLVMNLMSNSRRGSDPGSNHLASPAPRRSAISLPSGGHTRRATATTTSGSTRAEPDQLLTLMAQVVASLFESGTVRVTGFKFSEMTTREELRRVLENAQLLKTRRATGAQADVQAHVFVAQNLHLAPSPTVECVHEMLALNQIARNRSNIAMANLLDNVVCLATMVGSQRAAMLPFGIRDEFTVSAQVKVKGVHSFLRVASARARVAPIPHELAALRSRPPLKPLLAAVDTVVLAGELRRYAADVVEMLRTDASIARGPSAKTKRSWQLILKVAAVLAGRGYVTPYDVVLTALATLPHKIALSLDNAVPHAHVDVVRGVLTALQLLTK